MAAALVTAMGLAVRPVAARTEALQKMKADKEAPAERRDAMLKDSIVYVPVAIIVEASSLHRLMKRNTVCELQNAAGCRATP